MADAPQVISEKVATERHETLSTTKDDLKAIAPEQRELYLMFAEKDEAWRAQQTKSLLRKVDIRLLPLLIIMYLLNFLDRNNLSQARLGTLEKDLGMAGTDFNLATSILFVGYLLMQLPSNLLLTRVKPSLYLGIVMAIWGVVSAAQAAVHSFGGLLATRIILGVVEAPFFPGAIMMMSSWYTRAELGHRIAWFYAGSSLANMFGGLIAAGVLSNLEGAHGIAGWRWLFIIEGVITVGISLIAAVVLPNFPSDPKVKWLSPEERSFAQWRLVADAKEADDASSISLWSGLMLALKDYRLYLFILMQHVSLLSQTFQYFFPSIVKTLQYGRVETLLLTVPVWFATFLVSLLVTWTSGKTGDRSIHICCLMFISLVGNVIAFSTTVTGARFFAMFLMPLGAVSAYQIVLAWVANSFIRPLVKRSAAIAICNLIGNGSNIYGAYMYPVSDEPQYIPGGAANAAVCALLIALAIIVRYVHVWENKKLARKEAEDLSSGDAARDGRIEGFRYIL